MLWVYGGPKKSQEFGFGRFRERLYVRNLVTSCENAKITRQIFSKKLKDQCCGCREVPKRAMNLVSEDSENVDMFAIS